MQTPVSVNEKRFYPLVSQPLSAETKRVCMDSELFNEP